MAKKRAEEPALEAPERRRSVRHTAVLQIAKLLTPRGEELCVVRDVSPEGLRAEVYCRVEPGERVLVELKTGHSVAGRVAWRKDMSMGMEFDAAVPILAMLAHCSFDERLGKIRPPRLEVLLAGRLRVQGEDHPIEVRNISQAGMKVLIDHTFRPDTPCEVKVELMPSRQASVRWARNGEIGLLLSPPISFAEFALWRRALEAARERA